MPLLARVMPGLIRTLPLLICNAFRFIVTTDVTDVAAIGDCVAAIGDCVAAIGDCVAAIGDCDALARQGDALRQTIHKDCLMNGCSVEWAAAWGLPC